MKMNLEKAIGCMLTSAYGDSLGFAVEFMDLLHIRKMYGFRGITNLQPALGFPYPVISDDTQMAEWTGVGLVSADDLSNDELLRAWLWWAYLSWYERQITNSNESRAPGSTCMSALSRRVMGLRDKPINDSAGCGGIMRAHPIGIVFANNPEKAFEVGIDSAALTHSSPDGFIPAGVLACLVAHLMSGKNLSDSFKGMMEILNSYPQNLITGTKKALYYALVAPVAGDHSLIIDKRVGRVGGTLGKSGGGWLGHDALAIAIYAIRCAPMNVLEALRISVNHSGDSDSTGAITGALMGALHGPLAIEQALVASGTELEHYEYLKSLATMLFEKSLAIK